MEEENPNLNALIEMLSQSESDNDEESVEQVDRGADGSQIRSPARANNTQINRYLSSSSAKKRRVKETICYFCRGEYDCFTFEAHLLSSVDCQTLYMRSMHLRSVDAVLVSLFSCLFCQTPVAQLSHHLKRNEDCLKQFLQRFKVGSLNEVLRKVSNLKRQGFSSRRSLNRQFESEKRRAAKRAKFQKEPPETFINHHRQETVFSNYKRCANCKSDLMYANEIKADSDIIKQKYNFDDFEPHRRTEKFFLCKYCTEKKMIVPEIRTSLFQITTFEEDNRNIFTGVLEENATSSGNANLEPTLNPQEKDVKMMLPSSIKCLQNIPEDIQLKALSSFEIQHLIYGRKTMDKSLLAILYQHQLNKYLVVKRYGEIFEGKIVDPVDQKISDIKMCSGESKIRGSEAWRENRRSDVRAKINQFGRHCISVSINLPVDKQSIATCLLQEGFSISTDFIGAANLEAETVYYIHEGHGAESNCFDGCNKVKMEDFLTRSNRIIQLDNQNLGTYISSSENVLNSFIRNIVKSQSSPLEAREYHLEAKFDNKGLIRIEGLIWPITMQQMNVLHIDSKLTEEEKNEIRHNYLNQVKSSISASTNQQYLAEQFNLTVSDAAVLRDLALKYQVHFCSDCSHCKNPPLPLLETTFCVSPDEEYEDNIQVSQDLLHKFQEKLKLLPRDEVFELSSSEWIENILNEVESSDIIEPNNWQIIFAGQEFIFKIDGRLSDLIQEYDDSPLMAIYIYANTCVNWKSQNKIVFRRPEILDCFVKKFNPLILKAAQSTVNVEAIQSTEEWNNLNWTPPETRVNCSVPDHDEVSLTEAVVMLDNNKLNIKTSSQVQFVFSGPDSKPIFKKIKEAKPNCFTVAEEPRNLFEKMENCVTRYLHRINGKSLLLCEVAAKYDYVGEDKSQELFDVYKNKTDKIESSDEVCLNDGSPLPVMILCDFGSYGQVLRKRRRPKVLRYTSYKMDSPEFKYSQVLLYQQVKSNDDLIGETVDELFNETCQDEGNEENVIQRNKRMFLLDMRTC